MMTELAKQLWVRGLILLLWMGVIYWFSDQANSNKVSEEIFGGLNYFVRKGAHMTEYAILFCLSLRFQSSVLAARKAESAPDGKAFTRLALPFLFSICYAMSDEWHQSFVPGRTALFSDVLIDSGGALIAGMLAFLLSRKIQ